MLMDFDTAFCKIIKLKNKRNKKMNKLGHRMQLKKTVRLQPVFFSLSMKFYACVFTKKFLSQIRIHTTDHKTADNNFSQY